MKFRKSIIAVLLLMLMFSSSVLAATNLELEQEIPNEISVDVGKSVDFKLETSQTAILADQDDIEVVLLAHDTIGERALIRMNNYNVWPETVEFEMYQGQTREVFGLFITYEGADYYGKAKIRVSTADEILMVLGESIMFELHTNQKAVFTDYDEVSLELLALNTIGEPVVYIRMDGPVSDCTGQNSCGRAAAEFVLEKGETKRFFNLDVSFNGYNKANQALFSVKKVLDKNTLEIKIGDGTMFELYTNQKAVFTDYDKVSLEMLALNTIGNPAAIIKMEKPNLDCHRNEDCTTTGVVYELGFGETKSIFDLEVTFNGYDAENRGLFSVRKPLDENFDRKIKSGKSSVIKQNQKFLVDSKLVIELTSMNTLKVHKKGDLSEIHVLYLYKGAEHESFGYHINMLGNTGKGVRLEILKEVINMPDKPEQPVVGPLPIIDEPMIEEPRPEVNLPVHFVEEHESFIKKAITEEINSLFKQRRLGR